jgi:adenylate kinase family enzyme
VTPAWVDPDHAREPLLAARTVHVVGAPGSGKTTTAARLADALGVRPVHLDEVARPAVGDTWLPFGARPRSTEAERQHVVAMLLDEVPRVTEGIYCGWADPLIATADVVVWLDLPIRVLALRGARRVWEEGRGRRRGANAALLRATWSYPRGHAATAAELTRDDRANSRATLLTRLEQRDEVVRCTTAGQARRLHRLPRVP